MKDQQHFFTIYWIRLTFFSSDNQEKLQNEDGTANEMNAMTQAQAPVDNASMCKNDKQ